jgi:hypothetical protein
MSNPAAFDLFRRYANLVCRQAEALAREDLELFASLQAERDNIATEVEARDLPSLTAAQAGELRYMLTITAAHDEAMLGALKHARDHLKTLLAQNHHTTDAVHAYCGSHVSASRLNLKL